MISYRTRFRERLFRQFAEFSAVAADCAKPEDKERLLGVIEQGFGGFTSFNKMVREVLQKRMFKEEASSTMDEDGQQHVVEQSNASSVQSLETSHESST